MKVSYATVREENDANGKEIDDAWMEFQLKLSTITVMLLDDGWLMCRMAWSSRTVHSSSDRRYRKVMYTKGLTS